MKRVTFGWFNTIMGRLNVYFHLKITLEPETTIIISQK